MATVETDSGKLVGRAGRFNADLKRLINSNKVDVNQLMPLKYKWAWSHYENACANN